MKIISLNQKQGYAKIYINSLDDLWHLSKIIEKEDFISARTSRKVKFGREGEKQSAEKRDVFVKIQVTKVSFEQSSLRVQGRIKEGPEDITLNSTHSIELSLNSEFKLEKEKWYDHHISRLKDAERLSLAPNAIICILDDEQANFGLVIPSGIKSIGEFALRLTKKRIKEKSQDDIKRVAEELIKISKEKGIEKIIVGSPMFWKDLVLKELQSRNPAIAKNTLLETVSTGSKRAFYELVASGSFDKIVQRSIASEEEKLVEQLLREISKDTGLYSYGLDEVQNAAKADAVENLLVSEKVADKDNKDWKAIRELIEKVEGTRGIIHIIDAESEAGKKLLGLGGIAALLRYKLR